MINFRGIPIAAAVNPKTTFPDNANTTNIVVPLAMNLQSRVLTKVRFLVSIPITRRTYSPWTAARVPVRVKVAMTLKHNAYAKVLEPSHPMLLEGLPLHLTNNTDGPKKGHEGISIVRPDCHQCIGLVSGTSTSSSPQSTLLQALSWR